MLVVLTILSLLCRSGYSDIRALIQHEEVQPQLKACVGFIMKKYFIDAKVLTYINLDVEDDMLLAYANSLNILSISITRTKTFTQTMMQTNRAYMIVARNVREITNRMESMSREGDWNPHARFLILIDTLQDINLDKIFNTLLYYHIYDVVVANGTKTAELYTYNPFENYACGKYYVGLTEFGKCSNVEATDLYPSKFETGLRNCVLTVSCPHWPPYSIDPSKSDDKPYEMGTEQYIFHLMSQVEGFKYKFVYDYDPEMFSTVSSNMSVTGPMTMLQTNQTDVMLGGLVLTQYRARAFFYVHGHLDQVEELRIMVKKASKTPVWKNFYLEFSPLVWSLLLLVSVIYAILFILLSRAKDKGQVVLVLLEYFFLHGPKLRKGQTMNIMFISWVWFAYLMNCFYQSSLVSLTTMPSTEYQISDEQTMYAHNLTPCISQVMQRIMALEEVNTALNFNNGTDESCDTFLESIRTVSHSEDRFTTTLYTIYLYHKQLLYDDYGTSPVYTFLKPYTKVIYAFYFYKGFPLSERLHQLALQIRQTGLSEKSLNLLYSLRAIRYQFHTRGVETRFAIPWYVFIIGISISSLTFFVEIASK